MVPEYRTTDPSEGAIPRLTPARAARVRSGAAADVGVRTVLTLAWLAALIASIAADDRPCSPADPTICGPDHAWATPPLLMTPVLLWLALPAGLVAAAAFVLADLAFDSLPTARFSWTLFGLVCAGAWAWSRRHGRTAEPEGYGRLVDLVDLVDGDDAAAEDVADMVVAATTRWGRFVVSALLVVLGVAGIATYAVLQHGESRHQGRAVPAEADVHAVNRTDSALDLVVDGRTYPDVAVLDTDTYRPGESVPVHVDPADPRWVQLDAEPHDHTFWLGTAPAVLAAGLVLGLRELRARATTRRLIVDDAPVLLASGLLVADRLLVWPDQPGPTPSVLPLLQVRLGVGGPWRELERMAASRFDPVDDWAASDRDRLDLGGPDHDELDPDGPDPDGPDPEQVAEFARAWRGAGEAVRPVPLVLLGEPRRGGRVVAVLDGEVLVSDRPTQVLLGRWQSRFRLRSPDEGPAWWETLPVREGPVREGTAVGDTFAGQELPGRPVAAAPAAQALPALPVIADQGPRRRLGSLMVVAVLVLAPAVLLLVHEMQHRIMATYVDATLLALGVSQWREELRIGLDGVELVGAWRRSFLPWSDVHGVRVEAGRLFVAWGPGLVAEVGPFRSPRWGTPAQIGEQLAAVIMRRCSDVRAEADDDGPAEAWTSTVGGPLVVILVLYAVEMLATWAWLLLR